MANPFDAYPLAPAGTPGAPPAAAPGPADPFAAYPLAPQQPGQPAAPREASGALESLRAGFQGSATGLAWRGRLPDLIVNPENSAWWERTLSGVGQIGSELPLMVAGAIAGAPAGAAAGTAIAPGAGTAAGGLLGAGFGMGAVPAAVRESLIQAYKSGEIKTGADFWNAVRDVAAASLKEGAINAVGMGGGALAARTVGKALVPAIGQSISVPTAVRAIGAADLTTQIATMATMPAALQGHLPDAQEFLDAAILVGGLHVAGSVAKRMANVYAKTGKTPAQQVADAQANPEVARDLAEGHEAAPEPAYTPPRREDMLTIQENLFTETARMNELDAREKIAAVPDSAFNGDLEQGLQQIFNSAEYDGRPVPLTARGFTADEVAAMQRAGLADEAGNMTAELFGKWYAERGERLKPNRTRGGLPEPERAELEALRARVADLEAQVRAGPAAATPLPARFAAEQLDEARQRGAERLGELNAKAEADQPLTDAERAERVFLANSGGKPEALAKHFGLEPQRPAILTAEAVDASAQRVYDDVLRQAKEADKAREEAGNAPLGDDHAEAVATLVRARVRTRAARLGMLPEDIYRERPLEIQAEGQATAERGPAPGGAAPEQPAAAAESDTTPAPELDLFGNPIAAEQAAPIPHQVEAKATVELPLAKLILSKDVPQFKMQANQQGVIVPLGGRFDRTGVGPIQVWERLSGDLEVISGRHRLDLARRSGEETIPAQIHREADGFTQRQAATLDAQLNIREEQGSVADYAQYFKDAGLSKEESEQRGLLARAKGRAGFAIARDASVDLLASHRAGKLSDEAAVAIASAAPGSARLQALGIAAVQDGKSILFAVNTMRAVDLMAAERMAAGQQGDIFGFDDSALREAASMAKKASAKQRQLGEQIAAVSGASKRPELARKLGVDVQDPAGIQAKILELKNEQYQWDNWPLYPELVAKLRGDTLKQDEAPLRAETPAEATARDLTAANAAARQEAGDTPTKLFQDLREGWYRSALGEAVQAANIKSAPAKGWQDFLKGQLAKGGVKADEIKWSGVEEWLKLQQGKVTKEQMADYLAQHGVRVEEVLLGGQRNIDTEARLQAQDRLHALGWEIDHDGEGNVFRFVSERGNGEITPDDIPVENTEPWNTMRQVAASAQELGTTKFSQYVLPGGQNYRELLLTLPPRQTEISGSENVLDGFARARFGMSYAELPPGDQQLARAETIGSRTDRTATFQSSHFDQPNILAHVRFNDRTDADGKRVLFIEEFQSDWAQQGKKKGFKRKPTADDIAQLKQDGWEIEETAVDPTKPSLDPDNRGFVAHRFRSTWSKRAHTEQEVWESVWDKKNHDATPSAPFVGKTDAWLSLAMKRMISYAAQHGYERVAWTRGEQQVERYTSALRHAVDSIEWEKTKEGIHLVGYKHRGEAVGRPVDDGAGGIVQPREQFNAGANAVLVANDLLGFDTLAQARRAILDHDDWADRWDIPPEDRIPLRAWRNGQTGAKQKVVDTRQREDELSDAIGKAMAEKIISDPNQKGTIEGEGIRIDNTGMAGFYDRIAPKVANDVLRRLGGGKVGEVRLVDPTLTIGDDSAQHAAAIGAVTQHGFDVTPAMKEKATAGQPLFQGDNAHRGSYDIAQNLVTIMAGADKSTVVHELGHSWLQEMKADATREGAPEQIKADWETLRRELAIGADGDISRASHEQFARSVERYLADGVAPSLELRSVFERFKTWLLDIYRDLRDLNVEINPELRQVLDRMLASDEEIRAARELDVPREYVPAAVAAAAEKIVPPPEARRKIAPGFKAEQASMEPYADEIPPGPGEAPDSIHVNYQYINSPDDVKLAMQRMAEIDQANIQAQRGGTDGVKSWAEANAEQAQYLNDILGGGPDTLHLFAPRDPEAPHVDVRLGILKKLAVGAAKDSARLRDVVLEAGHDATVRQQLEYMGSIERARMIQAEFLGERAGVARALNALKDTTEGTGEIGRMLEAIGLGDEATLFQAGRTAAEEQAYMKAKLDEILQNYKGKSVLDIARLHKEIGTLKGTFKFSEEVTKATKWEMVVEGWRSGLLSGPVTHTTNLLGTAAFLAMRPPIDALSAIIGLARGASPGAGETDRATLSMAVARLTGMLGAVQEGATVGYHTFRADEATRKTESYRTAIPGRAGEIIRIPLRLMGATDAMLQTMYSRGELAVQAMLHAFDEDLNPGTREFAERVAELKANPTEEMKVAAETAAERMTFNAAPGEKTVALMGFVNKWNLQWVVPFINTPINIFQESLRLSPFAPAVTEWRAAIAKGGVERDRALAEMALGTGIMALTMAYAFGGQITGSAGPDPGKNRAKTGVEQPGSIRIGDTWHEYSRIQPLGTLMGFSADMAMVWDHMNEEEKDKIPKMLANAFAQAVTNQTFLQGITNVINAMSDPTRFAPRFLQQLAGSAVPNIIGQPTTMADPTVRQVNSAMEAVMARIPGLRQELIVKRDWLGEPEETRQRLGVILPSRTLQISDDKVRLEATRLDLSIAGPPKKTHLGAGTGKIGDVDLTPEEQSVFTKVGGEMAHNILSNVVNSPGYDAIPDLVKRRIFSQVITASHRVAAVAALPPEKRMAYLQTITEKMTQELQAGDPP